MYKLSSEKDTPEKIISDLLWDRYSIPRKGNAKIIN
jgi:hypothetical protein